MEFKGTLRRLAKQLKESLTRLAERLKETLRRLAERLTGTYIFRSLPRGVDIFHDINVALPNYRIETIFDVGANVGQSANTYIALFPSSRVLCFEPVAETFRQLQNNTKHRAQVRCFKLAFSSYKGRGTILSQGTSTMNFLLDESEDLLKNIEVPTERVDVLALDDFCKSEKIDQISYLKIDTEGTDLEVLKGSENMLTQQNIDLVKIETGMNPNNKRHVPFGVLKDYLESQNYFLFGIYEQVGEWPAKEPHLRRTNTVFISHRMIETHRKRPETSE